MNRSDIAQHRVLIVEDEPHLARFVELELRHEGFVVECVRDGQVGTMRALESNWDVILLDVMLPRLSGIEVCRRIRERSDVAIIMLTARDAVADRVEGLNAGADDYVTKPFAIEELLARIRVSIRRNARHMDGEYRLADLIVQSDARRVIRAGREIELTAREFDLLSFLIRNADRVMSRETILDCVWGVGNMGETNVVDVYIRYLRSKMDEGFTSGLIHTVRGVGYVLRQ